MKSLFGAITFLCAGAGCVMGLFSLDAFGGSLELMRSEATGPVLAVLLGVWIVAGLMETPVPSMGFGCRKRKARAARFRPEGQNPALGRDRAR